MNGKNKLPLRILTALAAGVLVGVVCHFAGWSGWAAAYLKPLGDIFVNLLKFLVVPVVLLSMIDGILSMGDLKQVGTVGVRAAAYFLATTAIACVIGLFFANVFMGLCGFSGIKLFATISSVPNIILTPLIFVFCFVGTYAVNHTVQDIYLMIICGILGFFIIKAGFSIPPIILGLILGGILEKNFRRSLVLSAGDWTTFFTRPISCTFIIIAFLSLFSPLIFSALKKRKTQKAERSDTHE